MYRKHAQSAYWVTSFRPNEFVDVTCMQHIQSLISSIIHLCTVVNYVLNAVFSQLEMSYGFNQIGYVVLRERSPTHQVCALLDKLGFERFVGCESD